ncbi:small subunit ribosomal protein S2 [Sporothrix schenckii 1099-18]|uniref:Small subunit ribosomal protein S2 n=1 Tax=Sporothrix schenckii 1099-18 TaxID=1397361 RepID=A0A0F2MGN2_SPOSC|nr:small subunit ribosomal protein S2 [Sporothrix schenckii 1099-18]KJR88792.1 small subunit ribosomal protein S2 [Sporothrix schenckii 1099-18]
MIGRAVLRQSRGALVTPPAPISSQLSQICRRAFLSTDSTTTSIPSQTTPPTTSTQPSRPNTAPQPYGTKRVPLALRPEMTSHLAAKFVAKGKAKRKTAGLGSSVERLYVPDELIRNPPYPKDVTLELLMASQTHLGHNTSLWNPANSRYIHGIRTGIHIISLEQTALYLRRAARVVEEVAYHGGIILFVGTRKGQADIVVRAAELAGGCHVFDRWQGGTITNRDQMLFRSKQRIVDEQDRDISDEGFRSHLLRRRPLIPDLVVVLNPMENFVLLRECAGATVPTIGVIDTDADPGRVSYPIPANDDSLRSAALIAGVLGRAGELGQKRRLRDAREGVVAWENAEEINRFMDKRNRANEALESGEKRKVKWSSRTALSGGNIF